MREVLFRVSRLMTRRAVAVTWSLVAVLGVILTTLPLMGLPGYELSAGLCLALTFVGPFLANATVRAGGTGLETTVVVTSAVAPAVLTATVRTWLQSPCDPFSTFAFVPVLVLPSVVLISAFAVVIRRITQRRWKIAASWVVLISASASSTAWPLITGPQVFAFNHFGGFLPGPLYDEELSLSASLLWFRAATLTLAFAAFRFNARRPGWALLTLTIFLGMEWKGTELGFRASDDSVGRALGGVADFDGIRLHYPLGVSDVELQKMIGDLRFRKQQLVTFFGAEPEGTVRVWWYRSPDEKQRLVGAANTQFAKPWRREVHVNSLGFPHAVIKHEFVHALAAPWGAQPFGVAASWGGLMPHVGVIEGFAVAADNPIDDLTLHQWCAAMKKKQLLPDVAELMTPQGFYGTAPTRAYTTAGSFLRYLADTRGKEKLRALYLHGDFVEAFGEPLPKLAADYVTFLDTVALDPESVNQAFGRFRRGSLFERPCAREIARVSAEASDLISIDPVRARVLLERCRAVQPDEPSHALAQAQLLRRLGQRDDARALLESELVRLQDDVTAWADAALARADLAMEENQVELARKLWERLLELHVSPAYERTAQVRLASLTLPDDQRSAVQRHFLPGTEDGKTLALEAVQEGSRYPVRYLLARRLQQAGEAAMALPLLETLSAEATLPAPVAKEVARLQVEAAFAVGRCELIEAQTTDRFGPAAQARAVDWLERCRFMWPRRPLP